MGQAEENRGKIREGSYETKKMRNRQKQESEKGDKKMKTPMETEAKWGGGGWRKKGGREGNKGGEEMEVVSTTDKKTLDTTVA